MNLYELTSDYNQLLELLNDPDADKETLQSVLDDVKEKIEVKAENIAKLLKNMESDIEGLKAEESRLKDKRTSLENKKVNLKEYLESQLKAAGLEKVKTPLFSIGIQNNPQSVNVLDESLIPDGYFIVKKEVNKKAILDLLMEGQTVPGAELKQTQSLRIR